MKKKIKLIASDLDGTLLQNVASYTEKTQYCVQKALRDGVRFIVATGRIYSSAAIFARELGTKDYVISCNGAYVRHIDTGEVLINELFSKSDLLTVMEFLEEEDAFYCIYEAEAIYSKKTTGLVSHYLEKNKTLPPEHRIKVEITPDLISVVKRDRPILKLVVLEKDEKKLRKWKSFLQSVKGIEVVQSSDTNIEMMKAGVSKGNALKTVSDRHGISSEHVMAAGDHLNDASMLNFAGVGVAVGNADESLKKIANHVSDTNVEDGVAKAMEYFLWKEA